MFNIIYKVKLTTTTNTFSIKTIIFPGENSKTETSYRIITKGNLKYNSPPENFFFWGTGNGELPCVNEKQLKKGFGFFVLAMAIFILSKEIMGY